MPGLTPEVAERVRASIARQTLLTTLGVTVETLRVGHVELGLQSRADLTQQHGFLHAGAITTVADSACGYAAYTVFPRNRDVLTVDFSMNLVAPATQPAFLAVGHVIRSGRTITTCRGEVYGIASEGDRTVVALIQATLMAVARLSDAGPTVESVRDTSAPSYTSGLSDGVQAARLPCAAGSRTRRKMVRNGAVMDIGTGVAKLRSELIQKIPPSCIIAAVRSRAACGWRR